MGKCALRGLRFGPRIPDAVRVTPSEQLCLSCGMCCDGTLFDGVQLDPGEDAHKLKALGLPVIIPRARRPIARFSQPCAALCQDCTCQIYRHRPKQCRTFECKVFRDAGDGRIDYATALRLVEKTRKHADRVRRLLIRLGETEEDCSLGERFHRMQCRMEKGTHDAAALALFATLSLAVHRLKLLTQAKFYSVNDPVVPKRKRLASGA